MTNEIYRGSSQPLGYQSRDMNLFKGKLNFLIPKNINRSAIILITSRYRWNSISLDWRCMTLTNSVPDWFKNITFDREQTAFESINYRQTIYLSNQPHISTHKTTKHLQCTRAEIRISCSLLMKAAGVYTFWDKLKWLKLTTYPAPNDNIYCTATSLTGPWSAWQDFATAGTNTFTSQTTDVVSINGVVM